MTHAEFDLIAHIRRRAAGRADVALGIGDDCALLVPPPGMQLAVTMDALNAGVHFPVDAAAPGIGHKALAVNLSDLGAMGADPAWCTLSLSLPAADATFVDGFLDGFLALAGEHGVALVGGDTTRGPLAVCITAHGFVPAGAALRRDGANPGDALWVSGTLGDAAAALLAWQRRQGIAPFLPAAAEGLRHSCDRHAELQARMDRPTPRVALGRALRGIATACIDVSDGLLADLAHVCRASGLAAVVDVDALPASEALLTCATPAARHLLQATGGDDYELCFSAPAKQTHRVLEAARASGTVVTRIGELRAGSGVQARVDGEPWMPARAGFEHFG